jgi:hypothetical protein
MSLVLRLCLIAGLAVVSGKAHANPVCQELAAAEVRAEMRLIDLARDYPGTLMALGGCVAVAASQPEADQAGTFALCGAVACGIAGVENCFAIGKEVLALTVQQKRIGDRRAQFSCR